MARASTPPPIRPTAEQLAAVTHGAGALLVFGGPGSGKTRTLTARIAHLLDSGRARPQEILALTFTVRAADEMRVRLVALVGHDRAAGVTVATFHALCARLLRPHAQLLGRSAAFSIYDQSDVVRIVRDLLADGQPGEGDEELAAGLGDQVALAKSRLASPTSLCADEGLGGGGRLAALWVRVDAELEAYNAFDFADLVTHGVSHRTSPPSVLLGGRGRSYIVFPFARPQVAGHLITVRGSSHDTETKALWRRPFVPGTRGTDTSGRYRGVAAAAAFDNNSAPDPP